ncbi:putative RNA methyltransferase [Moraxella bovis]|uniref:Methyltransferase domain-containing protein n=1 Tax=Moraxella bovis TaxID=476 RepID=A0A1S9ZVD5_MORBO|nr:methyltransferase domain-containing protein [Moraxella bovis]AWY19493.1 methyltransferase domain-containing protein [Moraxella bovis]OOR87492.1 methyltransferase [Moraxella bovis]UYZ76209.1 methyltransferase domain-containing protein [Moraxella bovis]UYZ77837.1 methyltransferase domain-containing protein [Moraxella bovis]UYZ86323.1 methyltransferase domain-containing protein [Moraxella bovis]
MLICPICHTDLNLQGKTYTCQNRHSYDISKNGYVNLHVVQHKNSHSAGDTPTSVQARRRFLASGFYEPLRTKISQVIADLSPKAILDIGCGEGYYTAGMTRSAQVIGLDIAKTAIMTASRTYKNTDIGKHITWVVGTGAVLPVADECVDICTSLFSPLPKSEMLRVLKSDGSLLVATPAPMHLYAMREKLFDTVNPHNPAKFIAELSPEFTLVNEWQIDADLCLDNQSLNDLIDMTPYTYKAKLERKTALKAQDKFDVRASFCVYLFKRA